MNSSYLLKSIHGKKLYSEVSYIPIIDYHCHLSPKEIYEDKPFDNIGEMWLGGDHYKWRLMRSFGVEEKYITGNATWFEKFQKYALVIAFAAGNPLYHWTMMELSIFFGIEKTLSATTAQEIWDKANLVIREKQLSSRKLITMSKVEYIATTDDVIDSLEYHKKIREDESFPVVVVPSFRTDNLLLIRRKEYSDYIKKLSYVSGVKVNSISSLKAAVQSHLDFFCENGCKFSDIGIEFFPHSICSEKEADIIFIKALSGESVSDDEFDGFLGHMYLFLAEEYESRDLVMQWHLAVKRNANTEQYKRIGADCGSDCMGDIIPNEAIIRMLDAINTNSGMPKTILYTLNPAMSPSLSTIAGSFPNIICGASWWFNDTKRGIEEQIKLISETGHIGTFLGMLTDSRSFLSYARHDYFRRILCNIVGEWIDDGEFTDDETAVELVKNICYNNIRSYIS